jgi:osmoprotectant transport system permease protein
MRVSSQMLMGIAAVAAYAKGPGLGNMIFSGLAAIGSANAVNRALAGTLFVIVIALVLDLVYFVIGRLTISRGIRG